MDSTLYTSTAGTDFDDDDSDEAHRGVDASAYGSRHKALEVALKSKTKHLLSLVKMDGLLTPSPSRHGPGRRFSIKRHKKDDPDNASRRTSMSSMRSMPDEDAVAPPPMDIPVQPSPLSSSVEQSISPRQGLVRRFTLRRTMSSKSDRDDHGADVERVDLETAIDMDDSIDVREGVYDSSKKQRVPSWVSNAMLIGRADKQCDRVLWRAHVIPDPVALPLEPELLAPPSHHKPSNRLSQVFSSFGGHLRLQMTRTGSVDPMTSERRIGEPAPTNPPRPPDVEILSEHLVASPESSPFLGPIISIPTSGQIPSPRRPQPRRLPSSQLTIQPFANNTQPRHPLTDLDTVQSSPPAKPKITFDPALSTLTDRGLTSRPRSSSEIASSAPNPSIKRLDHDLRGSPPRNQTLESSPPISNRRLSGGSLRLRSRNRTVDTSDFKDKDTNNDHPPEEKEKEKNALLKFLKDLPHWLHRSGSVHVPQSVEIQVGDTEDRRRLKGEVVCLHYGTIDDAG
jgi:hypothetical protein